MDAYAELQPSSAANIVMVVVCVGGCMGACMHAIQCFDFGGLGWGGKLGGGREGLGVSNGTHRERKRPRERCKTEITIE